MKCNNLCQTNFSQGYGLIWDQETESEQIVSACQNQRPILREIKAKAIQSDNNSPNNLLIESDNYQALLCLQIDYQAKVDLIYIDPPYNTGNQEWKYNDKFVNSQDRYKHSKWLNMMSKRLELARPLLKDSGVIFISIGEKELANLKLLCNKIFGQKNFIALITRINKIAGNLGKQFTSSCDYLLFYAKNKLELATKNLFQGEIKETNFPKEDKEGKYQEAPLYKSLLSTSANMRYYIQCPDGSLVIPPGLSFPPESKEGVCVSSVVKGIDKRWRWSYSKLVKDRHLLIFKKAKSSPLLDQNGQPAKYNIYSKIYLERVKQTGLRPKNFLMNPKFLNQTGTNHLKKLGLSFPLFQTQRINHASD